MDRLMETNRIVARLEQKVRDLELAVDATPRRVASVAHSSGPPPRPTTSVVRPAAASMTAPRRQESAASRGLGAHGGNRRAEAISHPG